MYFMDCPSVGICLGFWFFIIKLGLCVLGERPQRKVAVSTNCIQHAHSHRACPIPPCKLIPFSPFHTSVLGRRSPHAAHASGGGVVRRLHEGKAATNVILNSSAWRPVFSPIVQLLMQAFTYMGIDSWIFILYFDF